MVRVSSIATALHVLSVAKAQCPYSNPSYLFAKDEATESTNHGSSRNHMKRFEVDDSLGYMTSEVGGPFGDQESLKAGNRGPTLLEDFIFRQKITSFDHERVCISGVPNEKKTQLVNRRTQVPERAVHARGAGAYGTFTSYGNYSNITAASFLGEEGKMTPMFVRFSTVLGSRGSADTARDIHGFATRL